MSDLASQAVEVVVTVEERRRDQLSSIAAQLERAGLTDVQALTSLGLITGKASRTSMDGIRSVDGVLAVEPSGQVQIAPPDADVQ